MKLKVLHVNDVAGVSSNLVKGLCQIGVEAELFQPTIGTFRVSLLKRALLPIIRTWEAFWLERYVKTKYFNVIHVHYASFAYMTLITQLPYVLHCHGSDVNKDLYRFGLRQLIKLGIQQAKKLFYSTPHLIKSIQSIRSDSVFLPNPIDLSVFTPRNVHDSQRPARVLSISKMDDFKGAKQIIEAIELLWQVRPDIEVGVMGFGNKLHLASSFINRYQEKYKLIVHDPVAHFKMPELINGYDIILGHQSFRLPVLNVSELESMACEKPVICNFDYASAYPEPPPILVSRTPQDACDHVLKLIEDVELSERLGRSARRWVHAYHGLGVISKRLLEYYRNIF